MPTPEENQIPMQHINLPPVEVVKRLEAIESEEDKPLASIIRDFAIAVDQVINLTNILSRISALEAETNRIGSFTNNPANNTSIETDFYQVTENLIGDGLSIVAFASGTITTAPGEANHPGIARFRSSAGGTDSGVGVFTLPDVLVISGGEYFSTPFKTGSVDESTVLRFGPSNVTTVAMPTDGILLLGEGDDTHIIMKGITRNASSQTDTPTTIALEPDTWYFAEFHVNDDATEVTFRVYDNYDGLIWESTIDEDIPTIPLRVGVMAFETTASAQDIFLCDKFSLTYKRGLYRGTIPNPVEPEEPEEPDVPEFNIIGYAAGIVGGNEGEYVEVTTATELQQALNDNDALLIQVMNNIAGSGSTGGMKPVKPHKTIRSTNGYVISGMGFNHDDCDQVIWNNLELKDNPGSGGVTTNDLINIQYSNKIAFLNMLFNGNGDADGRNPTTPDGLTDIKHAGMTNGDDCEVSFAFCRWLKGDKTCLIGLDPSQGSFVARLGRLLVDFDRCWFERCYQRTVRASKGSRVLLKNVYSSDCTNGIRTSTEAEIFQDGCWHDRPVRPYSYNTVRDGNIITRNTTFIDTVTSSINNLTDNPGSLVFPFTDFSYTPLTDAEAKAQAMAFAGTKVLVF